MLLSAMPCGRFSAFVLINASVLFMMLWNGYGKILGLPFLLIGMMLIQSYTMPDILVAGSHQLFLFRANHKQEKTVLLTSTRQKDRFVLKNWEKLYGLPEKSAQLLDYKGMGNNEGEGYLCGEQGCRFTLQGKRISYARSAYILKQDCAWADIVISEEPLPKGLECQAPYVIDKFDTWAKGTHAVWLPQIKIIAVADSQRNRPWSRFNDRFAKD